MNEETGLITQPCQLRHLHTSRNNWTKGTRNRPRRKYDVHWYEGNHNAERVKKHLKQWGAEGEEVRILSYHEIRSSPEFSPHHRAFLKKHDMLKPR